MPQDIHSHIVHLGNVKEKNIVIKEKKNEEAKWRRDGAVSRVQHEES